MVTWCPVLRERVVRPGRWNLAAIRAFPTGLGWLAENLNRASLLARWKILRYRAGSQWHPDVGVKFNVRNDDRFRLLGLVTEAWFSDFGDHVIGVDKDVSKIERLGQHVS